MSPRPLPRQMMTPMGMPGDAERGRTSIVRRVFDQVFLTALIVVMFSLLAAIPMRLIFGSWTPWTLLVGAACTAGIYLQTAVVRRRRVLLAQQWMAAGWSDTPPRPWPWDATVAATRAFTLVHLARRRSVRGFPVTVAEVFWMGGGMGRAATTFAGSGTVIVVRLPHAPPVPINEPALRAAYAERRIPPWTIAGDELYAAVTERVFKAYSATARKSPPRPQPMSPAQAEQQIERVLTIVALLRIGPTAAPAAGERTGL